MTLEQARQALKKYFGYDAFRDMQAEIIQTVYDRKDCVVLMPTGGGKSICYQIPAVTTEGVAVVVSPLISLMKDQVETLKANGIQADYLNSSQHYSEQQHIENQLFNNHLKLLYVSPEKIVSQGFLSILKNINISLFAIDEAHCISAWGHDFRPEYAQLGFLKQQFPSVPIIALTATADKLTRKDIIEKLRLNTPSVFVASFDRPNLSLDVRSGQKRFEQILDFIKNKKNQAGIIYCLSRKSTEEIATKLKSANIKAEAYHAALSARERSKTQEDFLNDRIQVVCATIAFGMGIDKSNVRWVIHYNLPKNVESYYQEIGRAGRDGAPAETILFYSFADVNAYRDMFDEADAANKEVQNAKLDRMLQYADAQICRRRILLNYFGENYDRDCGNCDVCQSPPQYFDGTQTAQMALSAVTRLNEGVTMSILIDVLRGSGRHEIIEKGYDRIKTYGVGRNIPPSDWQSYIWQIIQLGFLEIAYDDKHKLKRTPAAHDVLFNGKKVQLFRPLSIKERQEIQQRAKVQRAEKEAAQPRLRVRNELFEVLRELRREVAVGMGVPPYIIFSDATLGEMAAVLPRNEYDFRAISGVGEQKWQQFGDVFLNKINDFLSQNPDFDPLVTTAKPKPPTDPKIPTHEQSYRLWQQGMSIDDIAEARFLSPQTISTHILHYYEKGEPIDIHLFVSAEDIQTILAEIHNFEEPYKLKEIFDYFGGMYDYAKIRFALAYRQRTLSN